MTGGAEDAEILIRNIWEFVYSIKDADILTPNYDPVIVCSQYHDFFY